jgi:hypothetical protein
MQSVQSHRGLRARLRSWALKRQGRDVLPLTLAAGRVYILPTAAGWTFALLLATMFIAGMNYGNGLALLFTFWLTGFALVAMVQTQRGLSGLRLLSAEVHPVHAGDNLGLCITVSGRLAPADLQPPRHAPRTLACSRAAPVIRGSLRAVPHVDLAVDRLVHAGLSRPCRVTSHAGKPGAGVRQPSLAAGTG